MEVKLFVAKHEPHAFGIVESDIHSQISRVDRQKVFSTDEVIDKLKIDGYSLELSDTWEHFDQAQIVVYMRFDIIYKRYLPNYCPNLPNISFEVGIGKENKTILNFFYREDQWGYRGKVPCITS